MPSTVPAALAAHLNLETTTLATLWKIVRVDGQQFFFTDHDVEIIYEGNTYAVGVGYNRSAVEDKHDFSVDNIDLQGILDTNHISRADVRAGRFDGAEVTLTIVNHADLSQGGIVKRKGWFGNLRQNNRGEFDTELRGLAEALQSSFTEVYTPACRVDLGSTKCGIPLNDTLNERLDETSYRKGDWVQVYGAPFIFQAIVGGITAVASETNIADFEDAYEGEDFFDGSVTWRAYEPFQQAFTILSVTDRRTFEVSVGAPQLATDGTYFNGGVITFLSGNNVSVSREIETVTPNTSDDGTVTLYLRMPFEIQVGDTGIMYPGCDKSVSICKARFNNVINLRGFPHIPGDKFLKRTPDAK